MIKLTTLVALAIMSSSLALKIAETVKTEVNIDMKLQYQVLPQNPQTIKDGITSIGS